MGTLIIILIFSKSFLKLKIFSDNMLYYGYHKITPLFLKKGNTTFFIGTNDDKVDPALEIIKAHARKRVEKEPTVPPTEMGEFFTPIMVDVLVGGATVFVVDVDRFEKI